MTIEFTARIFWISVLIVILFLRTVCAQEYTVISGQVIDTLNRPIPSASVIIKKSKVIEAYTYTNDFGEYQLTIDSYGDFEFNIKALGYDSWSSTISLDNVSKSQNINVTLSEEITELNEVIVSAEEVIRIKKDTISILTDVYADGNENSVEDLLKKIPGITVNVNGTIMVGNQEIEKLMIDGDDLFERGYKILSKNMPAYPIKELEILKNYSNNRLLKGVEQSDKVALNLKLNEEAKRVWFGNVDLVYGATSENRYQAKGNLMNFGKKNKYYFLANLNNIGEDATGDVEQLVRPFRVNEPGSIGDDQRLNNLIGLNQGIIDFKASRSNFNNAELASLNAIFNPSERVKIKTLGFFNWDEKDFFRNSTAIVDAVGSNFTNTEDYVLRNAEQRFFGKVDLMYDISATQVLEATTKFNKGNFNDRANLNFNGAATLESLQHQNTLFDQKISYSNKYKDKKVLLLTGRFIDEVTPQQYGVNQFFYEDFFTNIDNADNVLQATNGKFCFFGFNAHLLKRRQSGNLFELQLGNAHRQDRFTSSFSIFEGADLLESPEGFQNDLNYRVNDLYLKGKYRWALNDLGITARLDAHQLFNRLDFGAGIKTQQPFFVNSNIGMDWEIDNKNKVITNLSHNTTNAGILDVYNNNVLTGFRNFARGTGGFDQLTATSLTLNYQLGNWSDRFFANTFMSYTKNHDFFSTNTVLSQNFAVSEKILIQDREFFNISSNLDYYLKFITSNIEVDLGFSQSDFKNSINNAPLRTVTSNNYRYGLELRSGFSGIFNYHVGTKWTTNSIETSMENTFTNNLSFADISFVFDEKWNMQLQSERYFFGNVEGDNTYYFLDFDSNFEIQKNKLSVGVTGKNLFNTNSFTNFAISDIGTTTTQYRLLPRFVLLRMEYQF